MAVPLVEHKLKLLPDRPGCYEMLNYAGKIIYVGKSKDLKHRVRSYFKSSHTGKVAKMVSEVRNFHTFYCANDKEAFLQEITLIQKYRPYFNIQLKQGRETYPYIAITKERNPMMKETRNPKPNRELLFGPYPNESAARKTLNFLQKLYPLRRCHGNTHHRPCLYYHLGECLGACFKTVPQSVYQHQIHRIKTFLNGNCAPAEKILVRRMKQSAAKLNFEEAARYRNLLRYIKATVEKQKIISHDYTPRDIFSYYAQDGWLCIQVFYLRQARLMKRTRHFFPIISSPVEVVTSFIIQFYRTKRNFPPKEILVPKDIPHDILKEALKTSIRTPQRGQKHGLLLMAYKNAKIYLKTRFRLLELNNIKTIGAVKQLAKALNILYPKRIDSYDIADLQGRDNVAAMVSFVDGKPNKKLYRRYRLHIHQANENAGMHEVIRRRYTRVLKAHENMPGLILMDGGKIQLDAALDVLRNELGLYIPVAAMVKDSKHRTDHLIVKTDFGFHRIPLNKRSAAFLMLIRIQNEIHRFVITYHRHLHTHHELHSELTNVPGIGPKTRNKLFRHFGSLKNIKSAPAKQLRSIGISKRVINNLRISLLHIDVEAKRHPYMKG